MVSFDVVSLFTKVPLQYTINLILDEIFPTCHDNPLESPCRKLSRTKKCIQCKRRNDFNTLLEAATSKTHFIFNNKMYVQHEGVSMGAPLAPVIADIFMVHLETTLMDKLMQAGVYEWHRYVDDTFVLIDPNTKVEDILSILNEFHLSIKFTHKIEENDRLEFLDVQVIRSSKKQAFETTIYRKPTFTGLMTNWNSYVPIQYKKANIISMINRALRICSTYHSLNDEINVIRKISISNDYPLSYIDKIIGIQLTKYYKNNTINKQISAKDDKKIMYVELPFIRSSTIRIRKQIKHLTNKLRPDIDIRFFSKTPPTTQVFFRNKDPIIKYMQSDVVYYIKCKGCEHSYIGKTERQCFRRLIEHGAPKTIYPHNKLQCDHDDDDDLNNTNSNLRRSSRLINKTLKKPIEHAVPPIDNDNYSSSIKQHEEETKHQIDWSNFRVTWQDKLSYRLLIKESLLIKAYEPELNKTTHSVPLLIYPEGLSRDQLPRLD